MRRFTAATTLTHNLFPLKRQNRPEAVLCKYKYAAIISATDDHHLPATTFIPCADFLGNCAGADQHFTVQHRQGITLRHQIVQRRKILVLLAVVGLPG